MSIAGLRVAYVVCLFGSSPVNAADNVSQHKLEAVLGATILIYDLSGNWESIRVKKTARVSYFSSTASCHVEFCYR